MIETAAPATRLWDVPVRIVHWAFVVLMPLLWWTAEEGQLDRHKTIGLTMIGLIVFRLIWGVVGSSTARFAKFISGPHTVLAYLRGTGEKTPIVGHNPLGGFSVIALLLVLLTQASIGLFAQDVDGIESGPLSYLVDYDTADLAREIHHAMFNVILGLVALHVVAILFYLIVKRQNLITPMITGTKRFATTVVAPRIAPLWLAGVAAAVSAGVAWWISKGAPLP